MVHLAEIDACVAAVFPIMDEGGAVTRGASEGFAGGIVEGGPCPGLREIGLASQRGSAVDELQFPWAVDWDAVGLLGNGPWWAIGWIAYESAWGQCLGSEYTDSRKWGPWF